MKSFRANYLSTTTRFVVSKYSLFYAIPYSRHYIVVDICVTARLCQFSCHEIYKTSVCDDVRISHENITYLNNETRNRIRSQI